MGGGIGAEDLAGRSHRQDRRGAAFDEELELLFGFAAGDDFGFEPAAVGGFTAAAARHLVREQAGAGERGEDQNVLGEGCNRAEREGIEEIGEDGADHGGEQDPRAGEDGADQDEGQQVQEAKGDVEVDAPIDHGNGRDQRPRERDARHGRNLTERHSTVSISIVGLSREHGKGLCQKIAWVCQEIDGTLAPKLAN